MRPLFALGGGTMRRSAFWGPVMATLLLVVVFGSIADRETEGAIPTVPEAVTTPARSAATVLSGAIAAPIPARLFMPAEAGVHLGEEFHCLALNIYWEARSESWLGQVAVAAVTLNRVAHPRFPETVCGVVRQGGSQVLHRCQFSWYCDGKSDEPTNKVAWRRAQEVAYAVMFLGPKDPTHGALWYHADYVSPNWAQVKTRSTRIGRHLYYVSG
ncbi:MAG: cell wall hydrolase [Rhodospirillales bacterium]|nr:MAG: cell wall hydrolase [Rhodospirillales bacterium]